MKFEVGDKVRIRKDLKSRERYNGISFTVEMEEYRGKVAKITKIIFDNYKLDIDDGEWFWSDNMLEHIPNLENGDIITRSDLEKGIITGDRIRILDNGISWVDISNYTEELKFRYTDSENFDIIKVERPIEYKTVFERVEDGETKILNETEKEYLKAVIKPFKNKIGTVCKVQMSSGDKEYLIIRLKNKDYMTFPTFPTFEKGTMYKGMKTNVSYTLKELELDDED